MFGLQHSSLWREVRGAEHATGATGGWTFSPNWLLPRPQPFDKAASLSVRALTHQGDNRDLAFRHLVNVPYDDSIHARTPSGASERARFVDRAKSYLGLDHRDVARHIRADDGGVVLSRHASLEFLLNRGLADTSGPAESPFWTIASSLYKARAAATSPR